MEVVLLVVGGVLLVALGIWTFFKHPVEEGANPGVHHGAIATTFLLTLTNPMTLLAFVGFFVAFGVATGGGLLHGIAALVAGVFLGSALWWSLLCEIGRESCRARVCQYASNAGVDATVQKKTTYSYNHIL